MEWIEEKESESGSGSESELNETGVKGTDLEERASGNKSKEMEVKGGKRTEVRMEMEKETGMAEWVEVEKTKEMELVEVVEGEKGTEGQGDRDVEMVE